MSRTAKAIIETQFWSGSSWSAPFQTHSCNKNWIPIEFGITCDRDYSGLRCRRLCEVPGSSRNHHACSKTVKKTRKSGCTGENCSYARKIIAGRLFPVLFATCCAFLFADHADEHGDGSIVISRFFDEKQITFLCWKQQLRAFIFGSDFLFFELLLLSELLCLARICP
ncbi:hypothetical protein GCK32_005470 [Trichostrongylus colubriformis]|uniref:Uncharacterized protein n=1 Tax=Trichostrongylus colubriformis TaxID=6319 RepID=A0AAN8GBD5_TRICO